MIEFDKKQKTLIRAWHEQSLQSTNNYLAFISNWIAFNAICYNLYNDKASIQRADIDRKKSKLKAIEEKLNTDNSVDGSGKIELKNDKWLIDLNFSERLFFTVSQKFTEDIIYEHFVESYKDWYNNNFNDETKEYCELKNSLEKIINGNKHYFLINMARSDEYDENKNLEEMNNKNIIIKCEQNTLGTMKKILYQVRCNIFHGEKTPGDFNDDRIVKSSLPILNIIVTKLIEDYKINNGT